MSQGHDAHSDRTTSALNCDLGDLLREPGTPVPVLVDLWSQRTKFVRELGRLSGLLLA